MADDRNLNCESYESASGTVHETCRDSEGHTTRCESYRVRLAWFTPLAEADHRKQLQIKAAFGRLFLWEHTMRNQAFRRHQIETHLHRRLKEDRNQHYENLSCPCWFDPRAIAKFKEQPKLCSCHLCGNPRRFSKTDKLHHPRKESAQ